MALRATLTVTRKGKDFRALAEQVRRNVEDATTANADDLLATAKRNAPVDTGFLRDHIALVREGPLSILVESQAEYSAFVEWGTRYNAARPFMAPAIAEVAPRAEVRIARALRVGE